MVTLADDLRDRLTLPRYPRSATYDPQWQVATCMGPNALWLLEDLAEDLDLRPGMRVLDLGCGMAATSIFLAREFGVTVWAADLWVKPTENFARIAEAGLAGSVFPIHAEAHDLKFADGYFDAVVSVDSYQYFGTADLYIGYLTRFLRPGGQLGIAVPGVTAELTGPPEHLRHFWAWDFAVFHTVDWWRRHWQRTGRVAVRSAREQPDGWRSWLLWSEVCAEHGISEFVREGSAHTVAMLQADAGRTFTFPLLVADVPAST